MNNLLPLLDESLLSPYNPVSEGNDGSTKWLTKNFNEICKDIKEAILVLRIQAQGIIDLEKDILILAVATDAIDFLATVSDIGTSVIDWLEETYPKIKIASSIPEFNDMDQGNSVFYLYALMLRDGGITINPKAIVRFTGV